MVEFKNYYEILGVGREASTADIKSAYKKLAKKLHPDSANGSEAKFKEANEAYEVLKNKDKRSKYDAMMQYQSYIDEGNPYAQAPNPGAGGTGTRRAGSRGFKGFSGFSSFGKYSNKKAGKETSFSDFFETLFGKYAEEAPQAKHGRQASKGDDYEMEIHLSLEECNSGTVKKIEITGANKSVRRIEVTVPAGVTDGTKIKVSNEGKPGKGGGANGDLYLIIDVEEHHEFDVDNFDIYSDLEIEPQEAVLGCKKEINTLTGKVELTIPPQTQANKMLRLKEKGLKNYKTSKAGDHFVRISINIPDHLSDEELELYKQILDSKTKKPSK